MVGYIVYYMATDEIYRVYTWKSPGFSGIYPQPYLMQNVKGSIQEEIENLSQEVVALVVGASVWFSIKD